MKKIAMSFVLALLVGIPTLAQEAAQPAPAEEQPKKEEPKKEEPKKEEPKKEEPKKDAAAVDAYKAYRTKGNTWTHKTTTKVAGTDMVSYTQWEVTEVKEDKAVVKVTMLDKDEKEMMPGTSMDIPFTVAKPVEGAPDAPAVKMTEEKIKVAAGEFTCMKVEYEAAGTKSTSWTHKDFSVVIVKMTSKNEYAETEMELVKFNCK
jgi:hypothetical protein